MYLIVLLLLFQGARTEKLFEKTVGAMHVVSLLKNSTPTRITFHVRIEDKADRNGAWELAAFEDAFSYEVARADNDSVVLRRITDYGFRGPYVKLFFDLRFKKVLKRIEFTDMALSQVSINDVQRIVGLPAEILKTPADPLSPFSPRELPPDFLKTPLPQSTYAEFARARPARVRNGYVKDGTTIEEVVGPYQIVGDKIWFGKNFYDGEGTTGVGGIGFLDRLTKKYTFLRIRELAEWSVSDLLVEDDAIWVGLVIHPEGADHPGGLIRYDLKTGATRKYRVDEVIYRIQRIRDRLCLSTSNGIYVLKADRFTHYLVEPDINGKPTIVSEEL